MGTLSCGSALLVIIAAGLFGWWEYSNAKAADRIKDLKREWKYGKHKPSRSNKPTNKSS